MFKPSLKKAIVIVVVQEKAPVGLDVPVDPEGEALVRVPDLERKVLRRELVREPDRFDKILIDRSIEQAYVFWLFSLRYDPASFQQQGWRGNFDKYYFDSNPPQNSSELFVSAADIFPEGFVLLDTIYFPNGQEAIKIGYPR